jgi:hypothetical protein
MVGSGSPLVSLKRHNAEEAFFVAVLGDTAQRRVPDQRVPISVEAAAAVMARSSETRLPEV